MYILLLITTIGYAIQSIIVKAFSKYFCKSVSNRFSFFFIAFTVAFLTLTLTRPAVSSVSGATLIYGGLFGALFVISIYIYSVAMSLGNAGTTSLIMSTGVIIPIAIGTIFFNEPITWLKLLGFILIMTACGLIGSDNSSGNGTSKNRKKWFIYSLGSTFTNGALLTFSKMHQVTVPGKDQKEFIWIAMGIAAIVCFIILKGVLKSEHVSLSDSFIPLNKVKYLFMEIGLALSICIPNLTLLMVVSRLPSIIVFPVSNTGSLIIVTLASLFIFKEKLSVKGYAGMFAGMLAIMILNF